MPLMFAAITGQASSVSVLDAMEILGPDLTRYRLRQALDLLGGVSKKENKEWEKLAEICQRQADAASDAKVRADALQRLGLLYTEKVENSAKAIDAWQKLHPQNGMTRSGRF